MWNGLKTALASLHTASTSISRKMAHGVGLGSGARSQETLNKALNLSHQHGRHQHECLLYLPLFAEVNKLEIGVDADAPHCPHRPILSATVLPFWLELTHGTSTSRPGLTYPAQFCRMTGLQFARFGGAVAIANSNPTLPRHLPMWMPTLSFSTVSRIPQPRKSRNGCSLSSNACKRRTPGKPLIFQQTIDREDCAFNTARAKSEAEKRRWPKR